MRVEHVPEDGGRSGRVLASEVELADSLRGQVRGLTFRDAVPDDFAMVFDFGRPGYRSIHMLFVRVPLDVLWLREDTVIKRKTLPPWTGVGLARADRVIELAAGTADGVTRGDAVRLDS